MKMFRFACVVAVAAVFLPSVSMGLRGRPFIPDFREGRSFSFQELCNWFCADDDYDYFFRGMDHVVQPRIFCGLCAKKMSTTKSPPTTKPTTAPNTSSTNKTTSPHSESTSSTIKPSTASMTPVNQTVPMPPAAAPVAPPAAAAPMAPANASAPAAPAAPPETK